ncbi:uncharacterized protein LOC132281717 [Cornus florida]|uniref:uncharacterized protein LOC132281717 n=1 Tax=Cornus florida TaxID=4283 RepID=UPI00289845DC|nr:uncharacterized protein LOC132281717 [Cornus florida]
MAKSRACNLEPRIVRFNLNQPAMVLTNSDEEPKEEEDTQQKQAESCTISEDIQQKEAHRTCTISDDEDADFQMALLCSTILNSRSRASIQGPEIQDEKKKGVMRPCSITYGDFGTSSWKTEERGECSHTLCDICKDVKPTGGIMIRSTRCSHAYCRDCLGFYIGEKIQESIGGVKCPVKKCKNLYQAGHCRSFIPEEVFDRWKSAAVEAAVLGSPEYILCPFDDCWVVFGDDGKGFVIRACPKCWRLFCVWCNVPWHAWVPCWFVRLRMMTCHNNPKPWRVKE